MSNSPADSDPRADADAAQASTGDSPADVGTQQKPVTTPDDAEPAADEDATDMGSAPDEDAAGAELGVDESAIDAEPETGTEPAADAGSANAESAADEDITDTAAPAPAPAPQDPAAPAAPVPTSPGSPPPSTGAHPMPATPIPAVTAAMGPVPAPPAAPVPPPSAATSMGPVPAPVATEPFPAGPVPAAPVPTGPVPTGSLPITPFPTGPASTNPLPVTPFPTGSAPVSSASTGSIPVVPAHVEPAPAGAGPAVPFPTAPVPAPPAVPVPPPPAVTASPRPLQAAAPAGDAPQWSRGQWWTVLVLGVLAAITGAAVLVLWYLDLTDQSYAHVEKWRLFVDMALLFLFSPFALTVVGIVQTCRKAAPSAFIAAVALTPFSILVSFDSFRFVYFTIIIVLLIVTTVFLLVAACMCLWGRLPHRSHTPRSVVATSALAITTIWLMTTKLSIMWIDSYAYYQIYNYTVSAWIVIALRAASLVCGIVLLALMIFHRKVIIMRILAAASGVFALAEATIIVFRIGLIFYGRGLDLPVFSIPSAVLLIALAVPVFCASFRQWCAGTWTAPAWKPSAIAGRPTILARTTQVTDPDGNPLNDADIAAMLPTTRPTFWVSLFFGLFGLLPMLTANSTARSLGVVTNAYNSAMIKGFVLGILMWTAIAATSYTIILFELL